MINQHEINCGYCINNSSPYDESICHCYKISIPYMILGHSGVINMCRDWHNYVIKEDESEPGDMKFKEITPFLIKTILKQYPQFDNKNIELGSYFNTYRNKKPSLTYYVIGRPYVLRAYFEPSFLIKNVFKIYHEDSNFIDTFAKYYPFEYIDRKFIYHKGHTNQFYKSMLGLSLANQNSLKMFITEKGRVKRQKDLLQELILRIEKI